MAMELKKKYELLRLLIDFAVEQGWDERGRDNEDYIDMLVEYFEHVGFSHVLVQGACKENCAEVIDAVIRKFIKKLAEEW